MFRKPISVLGIPLNKGQKLKGVNKGPKLISNLFNNPNFNSIKLDNLNINNNLITIKNKVKNLNPKNFNFFVGGDHSLSLGTISGLTSRSKNNVVVWIDAHTDCNNFKSSTSKSLHGMPIRGLLGDLNDKYNKFKCLNKNQIIFIGIRSIDPGEIRFVNKNKIKMITMDSINKKGLHYNLDEIKSFLKNKNIHISFDVDAMDPKIISSTGKPVSKGLQLEQIYDIFKFLSKFNVNSIELVEFNPDVGNYKTSYDNLNKIIKQSFQL